jgi:hypothetical protein
LIVVCKSQPDLNTSHIIRLNYIETMQLLPLSAFQKIPGERFNFGFKLHYDNGCREAVTSWSQNQKLMNALKFKFVRSGGEIKSNRFYIDPDFENIRNHTVYLKSFTTRAPYVTDSLGIVLDYRGEFQFHSDGFSGYSGNNGSDGQSGSSGPESGQGGHGQNGDDGEPGQPGRDGDDLEVFCDAYFDSILHAELLYVEVTNLQNGTLKKYLINPDGGSVDIWSSGGTGGSGGKGGRSHKII